MDTWVRCDECGLTIRRLPLSNCPRCVQADTSVPAPTGGTGSQTGTGRAKAPLPLIAIIAVSLIPIAVLAFVQVSGEDGEDRSPDGQAHVAYEDDQERLEDEAEDRQVLATYAGGEITAGEFRIHHFELPAAMRVVDNRANRKSQLFTLLERRLLALEASGESLTEEEAELPRVLRERIQIARLVDREVHTGSPRPTGLALSRARHLKTLTLGEEARAKFTPSIDEAALMALDLSRPARRLSQDVQDILALPPGSRPPFQGSFDFSQDPTNECGGEVDPRRAAITSRCGCASLSEVLLWESQLYFELYLSGRGLNVMNTHNIATAPCIWRYITSDSPEEAARALAKVPKVRRGFGGVRLKNANARQRKRFAAMLSMAGDRISLCMFNQRSKTGDFKYTASWTQLRDGRTIGMKVAPAEGTHECVQKVLQDWRFPELVEESTKLEARFTFSIDFKRDPDGPW